MFRPSSGTWVIQRSRDGLTEIPFGISTDKLVPADYDGDGKADIAVFRNGIWYIRQTTGGISYANFGLGSDTPINQV